jgi:hypothetical protein
MQTSGLTAPQCQHVHVAQVCLRAGIRAVCHIVGSGGNTEAPADDHEHCRSAIQMCHCRPVVMIQHHWKYHGMDRLGRLHSSSSYWLVYFAAQ